MRTRFLLNARFIFLLRKYANTSITGTSTNAVSVSLTSIVLNITSAPIIFISDIVIFSGPWCKSSVISNKSEVILDNNCPTFWSS